MKFIFGFKNLLSAYGNKKQPFYTLYEVSDEVNDEVNETADATSK